MKNQRCVLKEGQSVVVLVRQELKRNESPIVLDFTDYQHPKIKAVIPCIQDFWGNLISIKTGEYIDVLDTDDLRKATPGHRFCYEDGMEVTVSRLFNRRILLTKEKCAPESTIAIRAFGENF